MNQGNPPAGPEVVNQHNAISRAMYSLGTNARRFIAMAMSKMNTASGEGPYEVSFSYQEFVKALGLGQSYTKGHMREIVLDSVRECLNSHIEIEHIEPDGQHIWEAYTWFSYSKLVSHFGLGDLKTEKKVSLYSDTDHLPLLCDTIVMHFNPELGAVLKNFGLFYSQIKLADLGKLQSRYAIRFYEIAMSWSSEAGKKGNKPGEWFFYYTVQELRAIFKIEHSQYKLTSDFRRKCIDVPCAEIREADIGIDVEPEPDKSGRRLLGFRFQCRFTSRHERNVTPIVSDRDEVDLDDKLKAAYPEKYEKYKTEYLSQQDFPGMKPLGRDIVADAEACLILRAEYPDFVKQWKAARKSAARQDKPRRRD